MKSWSLKLEVGLYLPTLCCQVRSWFTRIWMLTWQTPMSMCKVGCCVTTLIFGGDGTPYNIAFNEWILHAVSIFHIGFVTQHIYPTTKSCFSLISEETLRHMLGYKWTKLLRKHVKVAGNCFQFFPSFSWIRARGSVMMPALFVIWSYNTVITRALMPDHWLKHRGRFI